MWIWEGLFWAGAGNELVVLDEGAGHDAGFGAEEVGDEAGEFVGVDELAHGEMLGGFVGPSAVAAVEAALEANRVCLGNTYKTTAMIADSAGVPIVVISNDGAAAVTQRIAMSKIQAVLKYKMSSGDVAKKAAADPAFAAELKANPLIDTARQGALSTPAAPTA